MSEINFDSEPLIRTVRASRCLACHGQGVPAHREVEDRLYGVIGKWSFQSCLTCQSLWLDPRATTDDLALCYPAAYFTHSPSDGAATRDEIEPHLGGWKGALRRQVLAGNYGYRFESGPAGRAVGQMLGLISPIRRKATHGMGPLMLSWGQGHRLLDVGCGNGAYLARMRAYGWDVLGQEIDAAAAEAASQAYNLPVSIEPLSDLAQKVPPFDVVTAAHVIEHVLDPAAFVRDAISCLRPGGRLVLITPNAGALGRRFFRDDWYPLDPPRHVAVYSATGLRILGENAGLANIRVGALTRSALKVFVYGKAVKRLGVFRSGERIPRCDLLAGRLFSFMERLGNLMMPVGEELFLTGQRPDP